MKRKTTLTDDTRSAGGFVTFTEVAIELRRIAGTFAGHSYDEKTTRVIDALEGCAEEIDKIVSDEE